MATWRTENSMLTQRGIEILNKVKAGVGSITVTRVVAGSGRVFDATLYTQTDISGEQKDMVISFRNIDDNGAEIGIYISNDNFTESFAINQIGVFVSHPDYLGEQLYHISQCDEEGADVIPPIFDTPITQGYSIYMEHGNSSSINISVNAQGMVSKSELDSVLQYYLRGLSQYTNYYVDSTNGSDEEGNGSEFSPFATIQKAIDSTPINLNGKGVRILVSPGSYAGFRLVNKYDGYFIIETPSALERAVINGDCKVLYCGAKVTLDRLVFISDETNYDSVLEIDSTPNINVNRSTLNSLDKKRSGIHTISGGINIGVTECTFFNCKYCVSAQHSPDSGGNCSVAIYSCNGEGNDYGFFNEFSEFILYGTTITGLGVNTMYRNQGTAGPTYADGILVSNVVANATVE